MPEHDIGLRQGLARRTWTSSGQQFMSCSPTDGPVRHVPPLMGAHLASDEGIAECADVVERAMSWWPEARDSMITATGMIPEMSASCVAQRCAVKSNLGISVDTRTSWRVILRIHDEHGREMARRSTSGASSGDLTFPGLSRTVDDAIGYVRHATRFVGFASPAAHNVVMLPGAAGAFVHEVFGHLLEVDASPWALGDKISTPDVSIVSDPTRSDSWARMSIDDEGVLCSPKTLIDRGVVVGRLADRVSAAKQDEVSAGSGRRSAFDRPVRIRQTHTALLPGEVELADLLTATSDCVVVDGLVRGEVSPVTGAFACMFARSWPGPPDTAPPTGPVWVRGNARDAARMIDGVGNTVDYVEGTCGKRGDAVGVSFSAPAVRVRGLDIQGVAVR